jgi:hypothetical protein
VITYRVASEDPSRPDLLHIVIVHYWRPWSVAGRVQAKIDAVLGLDVVKQLNVTIHRVYIQ